MTGPTQLRWKRAHDAAMDLCCEADRLRRSEPEAAACLYALACELEREAARLFGGPSWWRRVLRRSVKAIAWNKRVADRRPRGST